MAVLGRIVGKQCRVQGGVKKSSAADQRDCGQRAQLGQRAAGPGNNCAGVR